jgi:hypothetical protein
MLTWGDRPKEEANLLNPAFCCAVLTSAVVGYNELEPHGMLIPLAFLTMPIVLHKPTREMLPPNVRTSLPAWLQHHASLTVQLPDRMSALAPFVREAILFGIVHDWLVLQQDATIGTVFTRQRIRLNADQIMGEARECILRSNMVGKWFASAGTAQTVMTLWGIRL